MSLFSGNRKPAPIEKRPLSALQKVIIDTIACAGHSGAGSKEHLLAMISEKFGSKANIAGFHASLDGLQKRGLVAMTPGIKRGNEPRVRITKDGRKLCEDRSERGASAIPPLPPKELQAILSAHRRAQIAMGITDEDLLDPLRATYVAGPVRS